MQIQSYNATQSFSHTFSSNFPSCDSCEFIFLCFYFAWQTEQFLEVHLLVYSVVGIASCSVKQLFSKMKPKALKFFNKTGVSFKNSLSNNKI